MFLVFVHLIFIHCNFTEVGKHVFFASQKPAILTCRKTFIHCMAHGDRSLAISKHLLGQAVFYRLRQFFSSPRYSVFIYLSRKPNWNCPNGFLCLPYVICSVAVKLKSTMCVILCVSASQCSLPVQSTSMFVPVEGVCQPAWGVMDMITVLIALMKYVLLQSLYNPDTNILGAYTWLNVLT